MIPRTIRARLLLLTGSVVLTAVAVALVIVVTTYQRERADFEGSVRETTRALALVVERELAKRESIAWTLAASRTLRRGEFGEFHEVARAAMRDGGDWVVLADAERQLVNSSVPFGTPLPRRMAAEPMATTGVRISALRTGPVHGHMVFGVMVPVEQDGATRFDVTVVTRPESLQKVLDDQRLPQGWIAAVIDQDGRVAARSRDPERWRGALATADLRAAIAGSREGFLHSVSLDGLTTTVHHATSSTYGWTFTIALTEGVVEGSLRRSLQEVGAAAAALLAIAGLFAWQMASRLARPVERLGEAARALREGRTVEWTPGGLVEVDAVGRSLADAGEAIRSARGELETRVAQALEAAEGSRRRVEQGQRLEALGRVTGGVAHDVNNLLAIVANNAFVLERLVAPARGGAQVAAIRRAVETGRQLTRKLQALSPARAARPESISTVDWLPTTLALLQSSVHRSVRVEVEVAPDTPDVHADPTELEVALINLVVNAGDAMPEGGRVVVRTGPAERVPAGCRPGPHVRIAVTDTGHGMPKDVLDHVFEPFFTTKPVGKGTGLGLSQVYAYCTQHGGTVTIDSEVDVGTSVAMYLPAEATEGAPAGSPAGVPDVVDVPSPAGEAPAARSGRLLYVEDSLEVAASTAEALSLLGYDVRHAADASAALALLDGPRFDVVLSDVSMPGAVDGARLATILRERDPGLPVVLLTGYTAEMARVVALGFTVLQKPCSPAAISEAIERARASAGRARTDDVAS